MNTRWLPIWLAPLLATFWLGSAARAFEQTLPASADLLRALEDELARAQTLRMEDLEPPYFVQYNVEDSLVWTWTAEYGAITARSEARQRELRTMVRAGSPELDSTNFGLGRGAGDRPDRSVLGLDDDYLAFRQAAWLATDRQYKQAVETLTRKRAYLKDKTVVDRPQDFASAPAVVQLEAGAVLRLDTGRWQANLRQVSGHFKRHEQVADSRVQLMVGAQNLYVVNSEGTRLRVPDTGAVLVVSAEVQASDGMRLTDQQTYVAIDANGLPDLDQLLQDAEALVTRLVEAAQAPVLERYSGPVLFDGVAGPQLYYALLGDGFAARPDPVGDPRRVPVNASLEYKLGLRVLPTSFQAWDDPTCASHDGQSLVGHYRYDDEAVAAARVDLVQDGRLTDLCRSRAPTRKLSGSNGHGRSDRGTGPRATVGCLFVQDQKGLSDAELKDELLAAAKDEGLDFALRLESLRLPDSFSDRRELISFFTRASRSGGRKVGDPVTAYKVSVADGSETPVRGLEFGTLEVRALRRILAASAQLHVLNHFGLDLTGFSVPVSVVAPATLLEEVELSRLQEEFDKPPLLKAPRFRSAGSAP
ncbi:MAG: hypothetical protein FJ387_00400 [Verrucomicrobia bacterium]|nr:hypothetical protein [Verrucomicrobiota bacterium]